MSCVTGEFAKGRLSLEPIERDLQRDVRTDRSESWQRIHWSMTKILKEMDTLANVSAFWEGLHVEGSLHLGGVLAGEYVSIRRNVPCNAQDILMS